MKPHLPLFFLFCLRIVAIFHGIDAGSGAEDKFQLLNSSYAVSGRIVNRMRVYHRSFPMTQRWPTSDPQPKFCECFTTLTLIM